MNECIEMCFKPFKKKYKFGIGSSQNKMLYSIFKID